MIHQLATGRILCGWFFHFNMTKRRNLLLQDFNLLISGRRGLLKRVNCPDEILLQAALAPWQGKAVHCKWSICRFIIRNLRGPPPTAMPREFHLCLSFLPCRRELIMFVLINYWTTNYCQLFFCEFRWNSARFCSVDLWISVGKFWYPSGVVRRWVTSSMTGTSETWHDQTWLAWWTISKLSSWDITVFSLHPWKLTNLKMPPWNSKHIYKPQLWGSMLILRGVPIFCWTLKIKTTSGLFGWASRCHYGALLVPSLRLNLQCVPPFFEEFCAAPNCVCLKIWRPPRQKDPACSNKIWKLDVFLRHAFFSL